MLPSIKIIAPAAKCKPIPAVAVPDPFSYNPSNRLFHLSKLPVYNEDA
jgi:hypothetical protein